MLLITVPAVDRSGTIWFERNLGFLSAICTSNIVHFARSAIVPTTIGSFSSFHYYILPFFYFAVFLRFLGTRKGQLIRNRYLTLWIHNVLTPKQKI
jgi:hypothetical protein